VSEDAPILYPDSAITKHCVGVVRPYRRYSWPARSLPSGTVPSGAYLFNFAASEFGFEGDPGQVTYPFTWNSSDKMIKLEGQKNRFIKLPKGFCFDAATKHAGVVIWLKYYSTANTGTTVNSFTNQIGGYLNEIGGSPFINQWWLLPTYAAGAITQIEVVIKGHTSLLITGSDLATLTDGNAHQLAFEWRELADGSAVEQSLYMDGVMILNGTTVGSGGDTGLQFVDPTSPSDRAVIGTSNSFNGGPGDIGFGGALAFNFTTADFDAGDEQFASIVGRDWTNFKGDLPTA